MLGIGEIHRLMFVTAILVCWFCLCRAGIGGLLFKLEEESM